MLGVLEGFATIASVVAVGWVLAHLRVLDTQAQVILSRVAFYVASPALLIVVMSRTSPSAILSANLVASLGSVVVTVALYVLLARWRWGARGTGDLVVGSLSAAYVNAGNLGLPIALYVLGDVALIAPTLLLQLLVLTPIAMALLDADSRGERPRLRTGLARVLRNPVTVGALIGLAVSFVREDVPAPVLEPVALVGDLAVPAMLIAFGISMRLGPLPGAAGSAPHVAGIVALKLLVQPAAAVGIGAAAGLSGHALYAAAVTGALPTAQNVFTYANHYQRGVLISRDAIFVSTLASVPVILLIALVFTT